MTNSIQTIKNFIDSNNGLQRPNRYQIKLINLPSEIRSIASSAGSGNSPILFSGSVAFGARATDVTYDALSGYGFGRAVPKSTRFIGGITISMPVTGNQWILKTINTWFDYLYGNTTNRSSSNKFIVPYYDLAVRPVIMEVSLLDMNGGPVDGGKYTFTEVYPIEAMPIELSMANVDKFLTYQVSFNFRRFYT